MAIDRYPNNPDLFADRAEAHIKRANRFDFDEDIKLSSLTEAVADANRAIQLDPSMAKAYRWKGSALLKLEEFQAAKEALDAGASLAPGDTRFSQLIKECVQGIAAVDENRRRNLLKISAVAEKTKTATSHPLFAAKLKKEEREENIDGHADEDERRAKSKSFEKEERLDGDADEDERRAKSKSFVEPSGTIFRPRNSVSQTHLPINMAKIIEKKDKEAFVDDVRFYSMAIDRYPNNPDLFADRAEADIKRANRFDFDEDIKLSSLTEAVADANRAIQLDPSMAKAYLCKGTALLKLEEFQTAKSALEVGASLAPGDTKFSQLIKECVQGIAAVDENRRRNLRKISAVAEKIKTATSHPLFAAKLKKEEREENLDGHAYEDERRARSKSFVEPSGTIFRGKVPQKLERMNEQSIQGSNASLYSVEMLMRELAFEKAKRCSFDEIATFTSNFDNEIGSGAFGNVYKGQFSDGTEVAVKVLKMHDFVHHSFLAEIRTMGKTDHQNLIKLIGFCLEENMLALVYEYMENGSLDMILYKKPLTLEWDKLYAIAVELANAIAYLHHHCGDQIIHHDIKASNVLLDSNYLPKLSDFGLANLKDMERTHLTLTKCRGTPGYAAPEIWTPFSPITCKCDVYSFGMILFEILGMERNKRPDIWFPRHVWNKFNSGTLDDLITECGISENDRKKATILSLVALWCAQHTPEARPPMSMVATVLEDEIRVKMPPNPFLTSDPPDTMSPA